MFGILKSLFGSTSSEQIKEMIANGALLVDVRTSGEFASGSVKGAVNIPLDRVSAQIAKFKNTKGVVVFCQSGMRSSQAKNILEKNGIQNVVNGGSWYSVKALV